MGKNTSVYVDTSAFIAFLDKSDSYHPLFAQLFSDPPKLITSPLVINEGHAWFLRRYDIHRAFQFLNFVEDLSPLSISDMERADLWNAAKILKKFSDQPLTLADALGLYLMKSLSIKVCWSTDRHLGLNGSTLIIHQI